MKYEYNAINNPTFLGDRLLNKLGEEGWELVSHAYNSNTCDHFYTFKREKVSPQDIPAICEYSGLRPVEGYKEETYCHIHNTAYNRDNLCDKCLEENNK